MPHAFRCRNCGQLVPSAHAGERTCPRACPVCKAGVTFHAGGNHTDQPENWEALADASPDRLTEIGLTAADVEKHTPTSKDHNVRAGIETINTGLAHVKAKRDHWAKEGKAIEEEFKALDARYVELGQQIEASPADQPFPAALSDERDKVYQRMRTLADMEPSHRDDKYEAHLKAKLHEHEAHLKGATERTPQTLTLRARDGVATRDRS